MADVLENDTQDDSLNIDTTPSYLVAASVHEMSNSSIISSIGKAAGNFYQSYFGGAVDRFAEGDYEGALNYTDKAIGATIASGGISVVNSLGWAGNWLANKTIRDDDNQQEWTDYEVSAALSYVDDDWSKQYEANKDTYDMAGFIVTSFVPGTLGMKGAQAARLGMAARVTPAFERMAQTGFVGKMMSEATGLLIPQTERYVVAGAAEIAARRATYSGYWTQAAASAVNGTLNGTIDNIAFELAASATMFRSPILEDQSVEDVVKNAVTFGLAGGVLQGVAQGLGTYGKLSKFKNTFEERTAPLTKQFEHFDSASSSDKIGAAVQDYVNTPALNRESFLNDYIPSLELENARKFTPEEVGRIWNNLESLRNSKLTSLETQIHGHIADLGRAGKDAELGQILANEVKANITENVDNIFRNVDEVARIGVDTKFEKALAKATKAQAEAIKSNTFDSLLSSGDLVIPDLPKGSFQFMMLKGAQRGSVVSEFQGSLGIADIIKDTSNIDSIIRDAGFQKIRKPEDLKDLWRPLASQTSALKAEARWFWADKLTKSDFGANGIIVDSMDIPVLQKALDEGHSIRVALNGSEMELSGSALREQLVQSKQAFMKSRTSKAKDWDSGAVARFADVDPRYVSEGLVDRAGGDAHLFYNKAESARLGVKNAREVPQAAKMVVRPNELYDDQLAEHIMDGMVWHMQKRQIMENQIKLATDPFLPEEVRARLPKITDNDMMRVGSRGMSQGLFSAVDAGFTSLKAKLSLIGQATNELRQARRLGVKSELEAKLASIRAASPEKLGELSAINNKLLQTEERFVYYMDDQYGHVMIPKKHLKFWDGSATEADLANGVPELQAGLESWGDGKRIFLQIKSPEVADLINSHIKLNDNRAMIRNSVQSAQNITEGQAWELGSYYPFRPDNKLFRHVAYIEDTKILSGSVGRIQRIVAPDADTLASLLSYVDESKGFIKHTKKSSSELMKAIEGMDNAETAFTDLRFNATSQAKGRTALMFDRTDPDMIAEDLMGWHLRTEDATARFMINAKYDAQFRELKRLAGIHGEFDESTLGNLSELEKSGRNPYLDGIKTALDISQTGDSHWLYSTSELLDRAMSRGWQSIRRTFEGTRDFRELNKVAEEAKKYGIGTGYEDAMLHELANRGAVSGALNQLVRNANGLVATLMLRLDHFNAINNAVGATVLLGKETTELVKAIRNNKEAAGDLAKLADLNLDEVNSVLSPTKLIKNAMTDWHKRGGKFESPEVAAKYAEYKELGLIKGVSAQYEKLMDDLSQIGVDNVSKSEGLLRKGWEGLKETGAKITLNNYAEEFNRFVAAHVSDQIASVAVKHGIIDGDMRKAVLNTFVNRTQGNIIASQRPLMFTGALGQAVGLFQTYQLNMIQQLTRGVAENGLSSLARLAALQSTIYGMNGVPGFDAINRKLVGEASGNVNNDDLISTTYASAPKFVADAFTYGVVSAVSGTNLYTRGDINPRNLTVIPLNPMDAPAYQVLAKALGNLGDVLGGSLNGNPLGQVISQGIEHNGMNRSLSGIGAILNGLVSAKDQTFTTDKNSNITYANDLLSFMTYARLGGAKALDESIVRDKFYRDASYEAARKEKVSKLGKKLKQEILSEGGVNFDTLKGFQEDYVKMGGNPRSFNSWMMTQMTNTTETKAQQLATQLKNPKSLKYQQMMGGVAPVDAESWPDMNMQAQ